MRRIQVSFEFFPPATEEMEKILWESIERLEPLAPNFVSVTYGAGGSTRERTHATVKRILAETMLTPAAHLTCVAATREEVDAIVRDYWAAGVRHIVALRGDPAGGAGTTYAPHPGGYENAAALIAGIKRIGDFEISVSAYPEKHPDSADHRRRHRHAQGQGRRRRDAAPSPSSSSRTTSTSAISTACARAASTSRSCRASCRCRTSRRRRTSPRAPAPSVPRWLAERFNGLDNDPATRKLIAAAVAAEQVLDLVDRGVTDFHFYTMNRADLVYAICHLLGLRPVLQEAV